MNKIKSKFLGMLSFWMTVFSLTKAKADAKARSLLGIAPEQVGGIAIGIIIAFLIIVFLLPVALDQFYNVNVTGWDSSLASMWNALPKVVVVVIVIAVIGVAAWVSTRES